MRECQGAMQPRGAREFERSEAWLSQVKPHHCPQPLLFTLSFSMGPQGSAELPIVYSRGHREVKEQGQCRQKPA